MSRNDAQRMVKRRAKEAGLPVNICNHTFRATGIKAHLSNGRATKLSASRFKKSPLF